MTAHSDDCTCTNPITLVPVASDCSPSTADLPPSISESARVIALAKVQRQLQSLCDAIDAHTEDFAKTHDPEIKRWILTLWEQFRELELVERLYLRTGQRRTKRGPQ